MNQSPQEEANILRARYGSNLRILVGGLTRGTVNEASHIVDDVVGQAIGDGEVRSLPEEALHTWLNTAVLKAALTLARGAHRSGSSSCP